jgi:hypothetical protein
MVLAHSAGLNIASGEGWEARVDGGTWSPAALAAARLEYAEAPKSMRPDLALLRSLWLLLPAAALGALWGWRQPLWVTPAHLAGALVLLWIALGVSNLPRLPHYLGFDFSFHVEYIAYIAAHHRLPLANEGWQMFQSPLYYALSAPLYAFLEPLVSPVALFRILRIIPMLCGVAQVDLCRRAALYALPRRKDLQCIAVLVGGLMPMNLYMSQSLGNEPLSGCLTALAIVLGLRFLRQPGARGGKSMAASGAAVGLALLAKVSAIVILPAFLVAAARTGRKAWYRAAILLAACMLVCGWYYLRNLLAFGRPFIAGWDPRGMPWWQDPGYRTVGFFFTFGQSILHPVYAGLNGFWDSVYSTVWTDGFLSGIAMSDFRPPWNYSLMTALSLLSLFPTAAVIVGMLRAPRDKCLCFAAACVVLFLLALADLYLTLPVYSTAKGTYLLGLTPCIAVLCAAGSESIVRLNWLRATAYACLTAWAAVAFGTFLVVAGT